MRNILLKFLSILVIFNLLSYSVAPAVFYARVFAQDDWEDSGGDNGGDGGGDKGGGDESGGDEGESDESGGSEEQGGGDFEDYSQDIAQAETQEPAIPQESDFIGEPVSFTPSLEVEQQQQVAYYDDLLSSEEQNQLVS